MEEITIEPYVQKVKPPIVIILMPPLNRWIPIQFATMHLKPNTQTILEDSSWPTWKPAHTKIVLDIVIMITSKLAMMWNPLLKFEKWSPFAKVVTILPIPLEIMNWQHVTMFEFYKLWFTSFNPTSHKLINF